MTAMPADRLVAHLRNELGAWPPPPGELVIATSEARVEPGWDGVVRDFWCVRDADGGAVASVAPDRVDALSGVRTLDELADALDRRFVDVMFRWCEEPVDLEPLGAWIPAVDERVPEWLEPFGGDVLVHLEDDRYVGGVGLKRHDDHASEISVGTEEAARGRGIARRLVVTAARRVLDEGKVPTYLHDLRNHASAKVAEASGFPDRGWRLVAPVPR